MSARFSAVPRSAIDDDRLDEYDLLVLMALGCHTDEVGWCWPSQSTLAKKARIHRNTVSGRIQRLIRFGYVERYVPDNGDLSKIRYRVIMDTARAPEEIATLPAEPLALQTGKGLPAPGASLAHPKGKLAAQVGKPCPPDGHKREPTNYSKEREDIAALFEEVWGPWSRKLRAAGHATRDRGKAKTFEIFARKARKTDPALIRTMALQHLGSVETGWLCGLTVWLNQERYDTGENVVAMPSGVDWALRLEAWRETNNWRLEWGPKPGEPGYRGPASQPQPQGALL